MKRFTRIAAGVSALAVAMASSPAYAQYANEYMPPKLSHRGTTTHAIAGNGTVIVQVQVNADGSHHVTKILKSSNSADNAAAMDIAAQSSYKPGTRGGKAVTAFYDFTLKFNGSSVSADTGESTSGAAGQIDSLIRAKKYSDAIEKAQSALENNPNDSSVNQLLGLAQYYANDETAAAATFSKVSNVSKQFVPVAAQAYAAAAVKAAPSNPAQALQYAQKAVSLDNSNNSHFALGVAQNASKQYPDAVATLKALHDRVSDPKIKAAIDAQLLQSYYATNDSADATTTSAELKRLDPNAASSGARMEGNHLLQAGSEAMDKKNYDAALSDFDQAASSNDSQVAVTGNTLAAFAIFRMDKPDYKKGKSYADKALAAAPSDPQANFAEGVAYAGLYASSRSDDDKKQAVSYLNKADGLAKAAGNTQLAQNIEATLKQVSQ
ncbi:MAG: energy transducer TonB [Candidatus Eremiobacteraeota bacterium]|nr:energy transducer TonB [Candidatus Eremiobacteraeota bacterium]